MKQIVNYIVRSQKLAGFLMMKGFKLHSIQPSNENDIVLDLFCGSGTSMVVAKELGRRYIGCDISERAIEISEKRLMEVDGKVEGNVSECVS